MKDTIYLICTEKGVDRMRKSKTSAADLYKGEIPVKLKVEVDDSNWRPPFIEKQVYVDRWDKDIDIEDINFEGDYVTEEEAEKIREMRLEKMKDVLEGQGYKVTKEQDIEELAR